MSIKDNNILNKSNKDLNLDNLICLIWLILFINYITNENLIQYIIYYTVAVTSEIISLIIGSLLGNSYIRKNNDNSIIITFIKLWFKLITWNFLWK